MTENIKDKVAVITGASSGLGAETARHLANNGANLVLGARRVDRLEAVAKELHLGMNAIVSTDVVDASQVRALVDRAISIHGRIDVMINNAGTMPLAPLELLQIKEWNHVIDVNIKGVLYGIAAALPYMKKQKSGHFINVSSVAGHKVGPGNVFYSATKYAVRVISEGLRQEVKPYNIRTTILSPRAVDTDLPASITASTVAMATQEYYADFLLRCLRKYQFDRAWICFEVAYPICERATSVSEYLPTVARIGKKQ